MTAAVQELAGSQPVPGDDPEIRRRGAVDPKVVAAVDNSDSAQSGFFPVGSRIQCFRLAAPDINPALEGSSRIERVRASQARSVRCALLPEPLALTLYSERLLSRGGRSANLLFDLAYKIYNKFPPRCQDKNCSAG
jgi:hypothetical protein